MDPADEPPGGSRTGEPRTAAAPSVRPEVLRLIERLALTGVDPGLVQRALAHRSWCAEHPGTASNERLEFLGDAVLGMVVTDHIFRRYPRLEEGELAQVRASVVSTAALAEVAAGLGLGEAVLLGRGEDASGGREKPSILADTLEAVIAAVYLSAGWDEVRRLVLDLLADRIALAATGPGGQDYKTRLQELAQRDFDTLPTYRVTGRGPDHAKEFTAEVRLAGRVRGTGRGRSKKQAEQEAARDAWVRLVGDGTDEGPADEVPPGPVADPVGDSASGSPGPVADPAGDGAEAGVGQETMSGGGDGA